MINLNLYKKKISKSRGFVIPFTLLISAILLAISTAISLILVKELYFSRLSRESQFAYYAADNGLMCAIAIDDAYIDPATGLGIFESSSLTTADTVLVKINEERTLRGLSQLTLSGGNSIRCATSEIFNVVTNGFSVLPYTRTNSLGTSENGRTSIFTLHMSLGDNTERCAKVTVNKTSNYRQIISQGYANCPGTRGSTPIERAVVSETEIK